mgnify:CR=1 FL=1|jgi:transposase-like protein
MIDERKERAIERLIMGDRITDVAKYAGVSRNCIYTWLSDVEFKAEIDRRSQEIKTTGQHKITARLGDYIGELERLAFEGRSEKVRADCLQYLVNRVCGVPSSAQVERTAEGDKVVVTQSPEQLQLEFKKFRAGVGKE